jgi:hypothetical protein
MNASRVRNELLLPGFMCSQRRRRLIRQNRTTRFVLAVVAAEQRVRGARAAVAVSFVVRADCLRIRPAAIFARGRCGF